MPGAPFRRTLAVMDRILPSEWPYVIGFIAIVVAIFWLIGRAADRGWLAGSRRGSPIVDSILALLFGASGVNQVIDGHTTTGALFVCAALLYVVLAWRRLQRG